MPKSIDLIKLYDPRKNKRQFEAHKSPEKYILYGGAKGGGKTAWLINEGIRLSIKFPGNRGFLGCKIGKDFKDNALKQLEKFLHPDLISEHKKVAQQFTLINGSVIMYGGLGNDEEAVQTINNMPEMGWFGIDQAEQITEKQFRLLSGQLRLMLPNIRYKGLLTANPEPGWLRDLFIEQSLPDYKFIPALPQDNPFLPSDYIDSLRSQFPPELVKRLVEGDWDVEIEGNYLIPYRDIRSAIERELEPEGTVIMGVDVSRYGGDETVCIVRQGSKVLHIEGWAHQDTTYSAGRIARLIREYKPSRVNIDTIGLGAGVFDPLKNEGLPVRDINVGERALDKELYVNKKAEYYDLLKKRFIEGNIDIPDNSRLQSQLSSLKYTYKDTKLQIESKESMRKRGIPSPDYADALMLAFINSSSGPIQPIDTLDFPRRFR